MDIDGPIYSHNLKREKNFNFTRVTPTKMFKKTNKNSKAESNVTVHNSKKNKRSANIWLQMQGCIAHICLASEN